MRVRCQSITTEILQSVVAWLENWSPRESWPPDRWAMTSQSEQWPLGSSWMTYPWPLGSSQRGGSQTGGSAGSREGQICGGKGWEAKEGSHHLHGGRLKGSGADRQLAHNRHCHRRQWSSCASGRPRRTSHRSCRARGTSPTCPADSRCSSLCPPEAHTSWAVWITAPKMFSTTFLLLPQKSLWNFMIGLKWRTLK